MTITNKTLRLMAWERAKGELYAILQTYMESEKSAKFLEFNKLIEKFISNVESKALPEGD